MATINLTITYPDGKQADLILAMRDHYGTDEDGNEYTPAQLVSLVEGEVRRRLTRIYREYKLKTNPPDELGAT